MDAIVSDAKDGGAASDVYDAGPPLDGYFAYGKGGATNRIFLFYADMNANLCFAVRLTQRANMSALTLPMGWDVESAGVFRDSRACNIYYAGTADFLPALSMSGSISWMGQAAPKTIDSVMITLNFMPTMWAPSSQDLNTTTLAVK